MYYYCLLPSGNTKDKEKIIEQLLKLNIQAFIRNIDNGFCFKIHNNEIPKLPSDQYGHYLPNSNNSGFSMDINIYNDINDGWVVINKNK